MILLQSNKLADHIGSIIHQDTQQHKNHFDLTIGSIHELTEAGALDFGGSEFEAAQKQKIEPRKNKNDDYGWWHLSKGVYIATLNEEIKEPEDTVAFLSPHPHVQQVGIIANTTIFSSEEEGREITMNFWVPNNGCNIKENARFAVIYLLAH